MGAVYCNKCGYPNAAARGACLMCYAPLRRPGDGNLCAACNADNPATALYCAACGVVMGEAGAAAMPQPVAPAPPEVAAPVALAAPPPEAAAPMLAAPAPGPLAAAPSPLAAVGPPPAPGALAPPTYAPAPGAPAPAPGAPTAPPIYAPALGAPAPAPTAAAPAGAPVFDLGLLSEPPAQRDEGTLPPPAEGVIDLDAEPAEGEQKREAKATDDWTLDVDDRPQ